MNKLAMSRVCRRSLRQQSLPVLLLIAFTLQTGLALGTVVSLQAEGDYIALSADSSVVGDSRRPCKIAVLGDQIVFAPSGIAGHPDEWNAFQIARHEFSALARTQDDRLIQKLADTYGQRFADKINRDLKADDSGELLSYLLNGSGIAGEAIFAGFNQKHQRVIVQVNVGLHTREERAVQYSTQLISSDDAHEMLVIGDSRIVQEYESNITARSKTWRRALTIKSRNRELKDRLAAKAEEMVALTAKYDPTYVQRPSDVVLVTRNHGATWIRRKPECALLELNENRSK